MQTVLALFAVLAPVPSTGPGGAVSPDTVRPGGTAVFSVTCADGVRSASVSGTPLGLAASIPLDPGPSPGVFAAAVGIPADTEEGTYKLSIECADGTSTAVRLVVAPTGGVATGGGSATHGPNRALMAAGGGLLVIGAVGAVVLRRRPD